MNCRCQKEKWHGESNDQIVFPEYIYQDEDVDFDLCQIEPNNK